MPKQLSLSGSADADLVGITVSDLMRIYIDHIDKTSDIVLCPDVISDQSLVSVRSSGLRTPAAIEALLRSMSYEIQDKNGVKFVCKIPDKGYRSTDDVFDEPFNMVQDSKNKTVTIKSRSSVIDDFVASGARFVGCSGNGKSRSVVFYKEGYGNIPFKESQLSSSMSGSLYSCRG